MPSPSTQASHQRSWFIAGRWQEYEGEARANLLRIAAIGAFYSVELLNYHGLQTSLLQLPPVAGVDRKFHLAVTAIAASWTLLSLGVLLCLKRNVFPAALKYVTTACDIVFLSGLLTLADGPRSPLVVGYFLLLAIATLRFSLPLVRFATLGSIAGYLFVLGYARWYAAPERNLRIERYQQIIMLLAIALTGIVLGQVIRRVRLFAQDYLERATMNEAS